MRPLTRVAINFLQQPGQFVFPRAHIFGDIVQNLGAVVSSGRSPATGFTRSLNRITQVLTITFADKSSQLTLVINYRLAVSGIRANLLAADIKLRRFVYVIACVNVKISFTCRWDSGGRSRRFEVRFKTRLQIFKQAFPATFTTVAGFLDPAESNRRIKLIGTVNPDNPRVDFGCDIQCQVDIFGPDTCRKAVTNIVSQCYCFLGCSVGH